ncbi:MAG: SDR family NAD(P)-dependent oxidoreductase [Legionella sp.]|nr:SDR family NAD(P)-dependent oxidoreductase [Legionella sp.]
MKVAIITGAASGIGLALTQVYLEKGVKVVMVDNNQLALQNQARLCLEKYPKQVTALACDVSNEAEVHQLAQQIQTDIGRVDWLFNNAGIIGELAPIWTIEKQSLQTLMNINLFGMIFMIQAFSPLLFGQPFRSHVVNMASLYALCSGSQMAAYAMSKHAVLALSESLFFDLQRLNKPVDVSIVFPSFTDTGLLSQSAATPSVFRESLKNLLTHSKQALDVAQHILAEVDKKRFYILPDREVKTYCEERIQAILMQEKPHVNTIEKLMTTLIKRSSI